MKEVIKKEILYDLREAIKILEKREDKDFQELKVLSNHAIEDVAAHKDLDVISLTVLIYSIYKVVNCLNDQDYKDILLLLEKSENSLVRGNLGKYNSHIKKLFQIVEGCNAKVKEHLQDVMQAAKIKKGAILFRKGLSIGQAAGLMGLSNWDLQAYAGRTVVLGAHSEKVQAKKRLATAFKLFGV